MDPVFDNDPALQEPTPNERAVGYWWQQSLTYGWVVSGTNMVDPNWR